MRTYIIAEAGVNHNGDIDTAIRMIDAVKEAGCDCIKFQTFKTEALVTKAAKRAEYQIANTKNDDSQFEMLKKLELGFDDFKILKEHCENVGVDFMSTPFDNESADLLEELGVTKYKMSSGDITNKPLLTYIARKNKPMILSTGMCTMDEVVEAVSWIEQCGNKQLTLLHCTSNYPTPYSEVNMNAMLTLRDAFPYPVGYSDHTQGIVIPVMAVAMGATVIEKHFTLDRNMEGPDHKASLEPDELREMAKSIRDIESARGDGIKRPTASEMSTREVARKSIVAASDLSKGSVIKEGDLKVKRPGTGLAPKYLDELIGKALTRDVSEEELITLQDVAF